MMKVLKKIVLIISIFMLVGCNNNTSKFNYELDDEGIYTLDNIRYYVSIEPSNFVKFDIKDLGIFIVELYPEIAPNTVEMFKNLVSKKFYDGLIFNKVTRDYIIQVGSYKLDSFKKETLVGEFNLNGIENTLSHKRGTISMTRYINYPETYETMNSTNGLFFICQQDSEFLDGKYAAFGKVVGGMDLIDTIGNTKTNNNKRPIKDIRINYAQFVQQM